MSSDYKPRGYTSLAPYLVVDGAQRTVDFLVAVFAAQTLRMIPGEHGRLMHAEVRIDDTVLMMGDPGAGWPARGADVHVYVQDVDAVYQRALAHGAASVQEPMAKGDGDKRGAFRDSGGTTWWVATQFEP
jgi:PhnB protein